MDLRDRITVIFSSISSNIAFFSFSRDELSDCTVTLCDVISLHRIKTVHHTFINPDNSFLSDGKFHGG